MEVTKCPHTDRKHYAKNMCSSCYRKYGRNQNATKCPHTDRQLYSMGMCQSCYLADYHQRRTKIKRRIASIRKRSVKASFKDDEEATLALLKGEIEPTKSECEVKIDLN